MRRGDRRRDAPRGAVIGPRRQDWALESGEEDRRQRKDRGDVDGELQRERRRGEHGLQRDDDDEVKEIDRIGDAPEIEACASDEARLEKPFGPPQDADQDHAEGGGGVGKGALRQRVAADGKDRDGEFGGNRGDKQREQPGQAPSAGDGGERKRRAPLEREIEQEAPDDRVDAEQRHPPDIQVPVVGREGKPQRRDGKNDEDRERRLKPPVASPEQPCDHEQGGREQHIEPFLDRETPGDGIEVDVVGGGEKVLDVEEIADKVAGHQVAGQHGDDDQRDDIGRDGPHPAADEKDAEIAPRLADHPVDDLGREHKAAENEEHLDAGDGEGFRARLERRVGGEIVRNGDRERRRSAQEIERRAALHFGAA